MTDVSAECPQSTGSMCKVRTSPYGHVAMGMDVVDGGSSEVTGSEYKSVHSKQTETRTAVVFIRVIAAVVVIVALPAAGYAAVVLAPELIRLTCPLRYIENKNRIS